MHPILDKYYERDPYHVRSSAFVQAKGLVSNEKVPTSGSASPAIDGGSGHDSFKKAMGCATGNRSLSPDLTRRSLTPHSRREARAVHSTHQPAHTSAPKVPPAQGNIKVKRRSAQLAEAAQSPTPLAEEQSSDNNEPASADVRNPRKLSQFFPELTLTANSTP